MTVLVEEVWALVEAWRSYALDAFFGWAWAVLALVGLVVGV